MFLQMDGEEVIRDDMSDCSGVSCKSSTSGISTASGFSKVRHPSITSLTRPPFE